MTDQMPTAEDIDSILATIEALIAVSAALPQSRAEFLNFEQEDSLRYDELWSEIEDSLALLRVAGFWVPNPNKHKRLRHMRSFLGQLPGTIGEARQVPGKMYVNVRGSLEKLRDRLIEAYAPLEVQRELRESARRTNELFIIVPCRSECESFLTDIVVPAAEAVGLKPVIIERSEPEGVISEAILSGIRRSVLVLCDLTFARPNCYYEAGYAIGAFRRVILTCREDHDHRTNPTPPFKVHFDLDGLKITWWNSENAQAGQKELESRLRMLIEELGLQNETTESSKKE